MKLGAINQLPDEPVSHNPAIRKRVLIRKGEIPAIAQVARATFPPRQTAAAHAHPDMWELFICENGSGTMTLDNQKIRLTPGQFVLVEPNETHEIQSDENSPLELTMLGIIPQKQ